MTKTLVTGSNGLIGSEVASYFASQGDYVHGVDNNMRADFFGLDGDTRWNQGRLQRVAAMHRIPYSSICRLTRSTGMLQMKFNSLNWTNAGAMLTLLSPTGYQRPFGLINRSILCLVRQSLQRL